MAAKRPSKIASRQARRRKREAAAWLKRNRKAIAAYNRHVQEHGVFSEGLRTF